VARVVALIPDLLFGSRVLADLSGSGHDVQLVSALDDLADLPVDVDVLVVDLTDERLQGADLVQALDGPRTLGFYSHVDTATRERAEDAGFDLVVPRSRMAREGAALVSRLAAS